MLDPLGLVLKAGVWYLVAMAGDQIRTYRLSRVVAARALDERAVRPEGFDLATYWAESSAAYERDTPRLEVVVRVHPGRLDRLAAAVGERVVAGAERLTDPDPDGWLRLRLRLAWPDEVPSTLLAAGPSVEVLVPDEVRERMLGLARGIVERYEAPQTASPPGS